MVLLWLPQRKRSSIACRIVHGSLPGTFQRYLGVLSSVRALALCAVLVAIYAAAPPRAFAQTEGVQELSFDIPAQPLSTALLVFARQANVQLVFGAPIGIGLKTTTLTGHYSLPEALTRLLAGTGLAWRMAGGTITIAPGSSQGTIAFDTVKVEGTPQTFPDLSGRRSEWEF